VEWRNVQTSLGDFPTEPNKSPFWAQGPPFLRGSKTDWPPLNIAKKPRLELINDNILPLVDRDLDVTLVREIVLISMKLATILKM